MEAGRELDALVAEKVMRFDHKHKINGCEDCWYDVCEYCGLEFHCEDTSGYCEGYPHYSTDIAAAWQILARLRELGFKYISVVSLSNGWQCWGDKAMTLNSVPPDVSVNADTAPLAICLAALKAVGVEVE